MFVFTRLRSDSLAPPFFSSVSQASWTSSTSVSTRAWREVELDQGAQHLHVLGLRRHRVGGQHPAALGRHLPGDVELVEGLVLGSARLKATSGSCSSPAPITLKRPISSIRSASRFAFDCITSIT